MRAEANIRALQMAFKTRSCDLGGTIHHSDKGSQYIDKDYLKILNDRGMLISMGLRGQDNAYVERINGIIKNEYLKYWTITSLEELRISLDKAVNHYNSKRIHRSLPGRLSPTKFEEMIKENLEKCKFNEWIYSDQLKINQKKHNFGKSDLTVKTLVCPIIE